MNPYFVRTPGTFLLAAALLAGCAGYSYTLNERMMFEGPKPFSDFEIADANLHSCIAQAIDDGAITEAKMLEDLNCSNAGIRSLAGIEVFPALRRLGLDGNALVDVSPLYGLDELELLQLRDNALERIDPQLCATSGLRISLAGNDRLACADIEALSACGAQIVDRPLHCGTP